MTSDLNLYRGSRWIGPGGIRRDPLSRLPLLEERDKVLRLILNYLPLPYSVVEHGCGQKASVVIRMLALQHGIAPHALRRGLIIEPDLSPQALGTTDFRRRRGALVASNALARRTPSRDPTFRRFVRDHLEDVALNEDALLSGDYRLHLHEQVQFILARSHVAPLIIFWDEAQARAVALVADVTLERNRLFAPMELREMLASPEAWIFTAPLMGRFRIDPEFWTLEQKIAKERNVGEGRDFSDLSESTEADLFRNLTGAEPGSIGDPETWTWLNNLFVGADHADYPRLRKQTGQGERARPLVERLLAARSANREEEVLATIQSLRQLAEKLNLRRHLHREAERCETEIAPLARAANAISYFNSVQALAEHIGRDGDVGTFLKDSDGLRALHGIGVRLRRRIESAATFSRDTGGRIDARALNPRYRQTAIETIRQMNRAGLSVFVDRVGNLHGIQLSDRAASRARRDSRSIARMTRQALCFASHIDSVHDGGKFDGRLGVYSGIELVHLLRDLDSIFGACFDDHGDRPLMVSVYVGEEMTFTGGGVSLPGSAAVAGLSRPEEIFEMTNAEGERYDDCLLHLWEALRDSAKAGDIEVLAPDLERPNGSLLESAPEPCCFLPGRYLERHIEQGLGLHRRGVPLAIASRIAGIRHEDFFIEGLHAEAAGWDLAGRLHRKARENRFRELRFTLGIFELLSLGGEVAAPSWAVRCDIWGESNHAGATQPEDRRDPAVSAARLVEKFFDACHAPDTPADGHPLVGGTTISPGRNRNVIPGTVSLQLGIGGRIDPNLTADIASQLDHFARSELHKPRTEGGEEVEIDIAESQEKWRRAEQIRLTTDTRAPSSRLMEEFLAARKEEIDRVASLHRVTISSSLHQDSAPLSLLDSDVVLQIERSYGGSHNPRETELAADLLQGTVFQLHLTADFIRHRLDEETGFARQSRSRLPEIWRKGSMDHLSYSIHDACNLAAGLPAGGSEPG